MTAWAAEIDGAAVRTAIDGTGSDSDGYLGGVGFTVVLTLEFDPPAFAWCGLYASLEPDRFVTVKRVDEHG